MTPRPKIYYAVVGIALGFAVCQDCAAKGKVPGRIGDCVETRISFIGGVHAAPAPNQDGAIVNYENDEASVSFKQEPEIERSQLGDPIRLCLVSIDRTCPRGDRRSRVYRATNLRTNGVWELGNSLHACGGA
jgi:hypothetical protein